MYDNLIKKYSITQKDIEAVTHQIEWGKMFGDITAIIAVCDLVANGDIPEGDKDNG